MSPPRPLRHSFLSSSRKCLLQNLYAGENRHIARLPPRKQDISSYSTPRAIRINRSPTW